MNARLIGKGFVNSLTKRGELLFADIAMQQGKEYVKYKTLVDKYQAKELLEIADEKQFEAAFTKLPVALCVSNPTVVIENGEIVRSGVLLGWVNWESFKEGHYDENIFGFKNEQERKKGFNR